MSLVKQALFVAAGIFVGVAAINFFFFSDGANALLGGGRLGSSREAKIRPACYVALERPEEDTMLPRRPSGGHRIDPADFQRTVEMTAALNCYVVTHANAVCDPNNRAYIVDYINRYYGKMDDMLAIAARYGADEVRTVRTLWSSARNRAIDAAINANIRLGRLNKGDFGWSAPAVLKPLLEQNATAGDTCPPSQPAAARS
jgi:hypothetical protein